MIRAEKIYIGAFDPIVQGDSVVGLGIGMTNMLAGRTVSTCTMSAADPEGIDASSAITAKTVDPDAGVTFTFTAPAKSGRYEIKAVFTLCDGSRITKTATQKVV